MVTVRAQRPIDGDGIRQVHGLAFPTAAEADLVEQLRDDPAVIASVVALSGDIVVAHALWSRAHIELPSGRLEIGALGPVAVRPDWQRRGIGSSVIRAGLGHCWALGMPAVIVLGHPEYYSRFGFRPAGAWAIECEFQVPPEAFMIAWAVSPVNGPGVAKYHPAFASV